MSIPNIMQTQFYALGTMNSIKIFQNGNSELLNKIVNRVNEIDDAMSAFKPESDISRINSLAGKGFATVQEDTMKLLENSLHFSKGSNDCFTISIGPLVKLWGIGKKLNFIPTSEEILQEKSKVSSQDIILDKINRKAALRKEGQSIDLGGIAKGYAADEVKRILVENGVRHAIINLGGNIVTLGNKEDGSPWRIGVQNPLRPTGQYIGILSVKDRTIVTSGTNERFFIKDGIRYHHILDSKTGYPAQSGLLSVTVICENSMVADALTTSLFVMGVEKGLQLLKQTGNEAIFITEKMEVIMTKNLMNEFEPSSGMKRMDFYGN